MEPLMNFLIALALKAGVSQRFAKIAVIASVVTLLIVGLGVAKCAYDASVIENHEQKIEQRARPATDKAADERANDTIANAKSEQEMHNAIAAQPDQPIAPTTRALSCERLRRAGRTPPACR
jgi:hypothetical protein